MRDPYPWEDEPTREAVTHPTEVTTTEIAELADAIPGDAHDAMLTLRDPESRAEWVRQSRKLMSDRVDGLLTIATEQRIDAGSKALAVTLAPEARLTVDIVETLEGVKSIAQAGIDVAKGGAEALLAEVSPLRSMGQQSTRFPDGIGHEVMVRREQRTEPTVDASVVADVLHGHVFAMADAMMVQDSALAAYSEGIEHGIAAVMTRLSAKPWSQTALKALIAEMEATPDQDAQTRAIRLTHAIGVRATGNPSVKIERLEKKP